MTQPLTRQQHAAIRSIVDYTVARETAELTKRVKKLEKQLAVCQKQLSESQEEPKEEAPKEPEVITVLSTGTDLTKLSAIELLKLSRHVIGKDRDILKRYINK